MEYDRAYFKDKVCAVTGAASGVGLALCEELLESGAKRVVMADFNQANLDKHQARLGEQYPGKVKGVLCNVTVESDVARMVDTAAAFGDGRFDLLINCAGAAFAGMFVDLASALDPSGATPSSASTNEDWKKGFELNFYGAVYGSRAALKYMLPQRSGQIINIISGIAFLAMAYQSRYAATKAALWAFSQALRYELWDYGVRVSAATPGTTATAIFGGEAPPEAQSPHQSAQTILHGVALDERLIMGDEADISGGLNAFPPDDGGAVLDQLLLCFARMRRNGTVSFAVPDEVTEAMHNPDKMPECAKVTALPIDEAWEAARAYIKKRGFPAPNKEYFEGKTAVVTGGSDGLGLALCEALLDCGASKVVLADNGIDAEQLTQKYPDRLMCVDCDLSREDEAKGMLEAALRLLGGRVDILINRADMKHAGLFASLPDNACTKWKVDQSEDWERVFGANFYAPLYVARAAIPLMVQQKGGQIVNVVSAEAFAPSSGSHIYASGMAALNQLTQALRYEFWDYGVQLCTATVGDGQPPKQAAERILAGMEKNDRVICGDENDLLNTMFAFNMSANAKWDWLFTGSPRK